MKLSTTERNARCGANARPSSKLARSKELRVLSAPACPKIQCLDSPMSSGSICCWECCSCWTINLTTAPCPDCSGATAHIGSIAARRRARWRSGWARRTRQTCAPKEQTTRAAVIATRAATATRPSRRDPRSSMVSLWGPLTPPSSSLALDALLGGAAPESEDPPSPFLYVVRHSYVCVPFRSFIKSLEQTTPPRPPHNHTSASAAARELERGRRVRRGCERGARTTTQRRPARAAAWRASAARSARRRRRTRRRTAGGPRH